MLRRFRSFIQINILHFEPSFGESDQIYVHGTGKTHLNLFSYRDMLAFIYTTFTNFSMRYLVMCKVYTDVGDINSYNMFVHLHVR